MSSSKCAFIFVVLFLASAPWSSSAAPQKTSDTLAVAQYAKYINALDFHDLNTIGMARKRALKLMPQLGQPARDQMFLIFEMHYRRVLKDHCLLSGGESTSSTLSVDLEKKIEQAQMHLTDELRSHPYYRKLRRNGCDLYWSEGDPYVDHQPYYLYHSFGQYVSPAIAEFLRIRGHDIAEGFIEDAGLVITFDKVGERVNRWERYIAKYSDSPYKDVAKELFDSYLGVFMIGVENSRIFDDETRVLDSKVRAVYEVYIKQHPDTPSGKLIRKYLEVLKQNRYHDGPAIEIFLNENHVATAFTGPAR